MKARLIGVVIAGLLASAAGAQPPSPARKAVSPVGTWRGTSICLVRPSACNDEIVVYYITRGNSADSLTMDARKIVRGDEDSMGLLACHFTSADGLMTCAIPRATWQFRVRNDSLIGELLRADNTKIRDVRAVRAR